MARALTLPFEGLPPAWTVLFAISFALVCAMLAWTITLFVRGIEARSDREESAASTSGDFTWLFLVPALDEEVTILDSVGRLSALELPEMHVIVIDDGSEDGTARLLDGVGDPRVHVVHRVAPEARQGKAAALNDAYNRLEEVLGADLDRDRVIVTIVDADGRLALDAPSHAAAEFADPRVGGVQSLVRIYNRRGLLTWLQDVEFSVYGFLYQAGRNLWGTAGMGGNGQFNRLSALDTVADEVGPWRDRLTEDQDLGLRLIAAGWQGRQALRAVVEQQGLSSLRRLFRQRTRWSQGNLQAMGLLGAVWRGDIALSARIEQVAYLLLPVWQGMIGISLTVAIVLAATGQAAWFGDNTWWQLVFFYMLGFGGVLIGCIARGAGRGALAMLNGLLVAVVYALYTWMLWPVLIRSTARQVLSRSGWEKTTREPIAPAESAR